MCLLAFQNNTKIDETAPLSPDMEKRILLTVLHTFLMKLTRGIGLNIKKRHSIHGDHFL